jgi:hypothetical protein
MSGGFQGFMKKLLFALTFWVISVLQVYAPVSDFAAQVNLIKSDCKRFKLDIKMVTAIFLSESLALNNAF